ncbi:MAG: hypothetical protein KGR18_12025 [Acidobacteria bacterium]|nr:hypothetical protein [Acidobacteriota bacterium]
MFTSFCAASVVTRPGSVASRITTDVTTTGTWYVPTGAGSNGFGHKHASRRTPS